MSEVTYKTNRNWRQFSYRDQVPAAVLASQFDHLSEDDDNDGFFCYRGAWYHVSDFMRSDNGFPNTPFPVDGYASDSAFSGVIICLSSDGERYRVATFFS
jgi:hypothetical protein